MLIFNWLAFVRFRLQGIASRRRRPGRHRSLRNQHTKLPAAIENFEPRRLLSAMAMADSYQIAQSMYPQSVILDVLANDYTTSGPLTITSFGSVPYGSITRIAGNPYGSPSHDELSFTPQMGTSTTESFSYTVTDASGSQSSTTVTLTISGTSAPTISSLSTTTGPSSGGTPVTIYGSGFNQVSAVMFGSAMATSYVVNSSNSIPPTRRPPIPQGLSM